MIELVDFEGKVHRVNKLGVCSNGHPELFWDLIPKPKKKDHVVACPKCAPEVKK